MHLGEAHKQVEANLISQSDDILALHLQTARQFYVSS